MDTINKTDMNFTKLSKTNSRGIVPIIENEQKLTRIEQVLENCSVIVEDQTQKAREAKSVKMVNEHLDAARKAIQIAQLLRSRPIDEESIVVQRFLHSVATQNQVVLRSELYSKYVEYCVAQDIDPIGKISFFQLTQNKFQVRFKRKDGFGMCAFLPKPA
jgi:hypothetical protein